MPATIAIETYKFEELSEKAQAQAIDSNRDYYQDHEWWDYIKDEFHEKLEGLGYTKIESNFSGFYSQGDGASFTADVDIAAYLKAHKLAGKYRALYNQCGNADLWIERIDTHYYHEYTVAVRSEGNGYLTDQAEDQLEELAGLVKEEARKLSKEYYRDLEKEDEFLTSDENIREVLIGNDYNFTEEGRMVYRNRKGELKIA